jgi:beta-glucosidase
MRPIPCNFGWKKEIPVRLKATSLALLLACTVSLAIAQKPRYQYPFENPSLPVNVRVKNLLSLMTLQEKIDALGSDPSVPRLGVVGTTAVEGLHGEALGGPAHWEGRFRHVVPTTQFPQSYGLGQTWDPALLEKAAAVEAFETRWAFDKYHAGGLIVRAPNANLARDPLWGRNEETFGEDPYLAGKLTVAYVRGLQGNNPRYWETASLMKHFVGYNNETNRAGSSSNFGVRLFQEYYALPFRMGIEDGHSNAFMTSYNAWNGIPMTVNPVLRRVVMRRWHFDGIICTDAGAMTNMVDHFHYYQTLPQAAAGAIHAGVNQFLDRYQKPVEEALAEHLITEKDIDRNLAGVYRVMIHLGMLDPASMNPYALIGITHVDPAKGDPWWWPSHIQVALQATEESIVLLKDQDRALPLDAARLHSIAVIGPWANTVNLDWYSGTPPFAITPVQGIQKFVGPNVKVTYNNGSNLAAAAALAKKSDVAIVIIGNNPTCDAGWGVCNVPSDGKEAFDRTSMTLPGEAIARAVYAANPHTVVVVQTSFPYTINWTEAHIPGILEMTNNSEEQGTALANVLFGKYDPAGRLTQTWVRSMSQLPPLMDYNIRHGFTYLYFHHKPLYPFGFGLSYTTFQYSNLRLSSNTLPANGQITVSVDVTNTGKRDGDEVVQMYVKHLDSKVARSIEALKGFERINIPVGQTRTVTFPLTAKALAYWSYGGWRVEHDHVQILIGASSADIRQKAEITVE